MRLLVVDDDAPVREALELVLGLDGFEVSTAANGREAIRTLSTGRPDAVILDVLMPDLDGLEVCRRSRPRKRPARTDAARPAARRRAASDGLSGRSRERKEVVWLD
jgi:DNA-binding response OmpR family regulator